MKYLPGGIMNDERPPGQQAIKEENLRRLFLALLERGERTRVDLSRATGLSAATVSSLVEELVRAGLICETGPVKTDNIGRKPINLRLRAEGRQIPVFALGRWGVQFVLYDLELKPVEAFYIPHDSERYGGFEESAPDGNPDTGTDYADIFRGALSRSRMFDPARAPAVCIAFPGIFIEEKQVFSMSALRASFRRAVMADLEREIGVPLFFGNTPTAQVYAEKKALEALGERVDDLIYLCVRDGVGAGLLLGGDLFRGAASTAGEIGHVTVGDAGGRCVCGNRGCLEQYANLDAILARVRRAAPDGEAGDPVTLESIRAAYEAGVPAVVLAVNEIAEKLFRGIYSAVCVTGIKRIAIGGGIERLGDGFLASLRAFSDEDGGRLLMRGVAIDYARSGPSSDALGIAAYYLNKVFIFGAQSG